MSGACWFCGEPSFMDIQEAWGHDFTIRTCCEASHHEACQAMADDPEWAAALLRRLGALPDLRRVVATDGGFGGIRFDFQPRVHPIGRPEAMRFVRDHHEHNGPLPIDLFRAAVWNGPTLLGVVVVGNPTSTGYMHRGWVEIRRLCLDRGVPDEFRWKACSILYGWAATEAERRGWRRITTYTLRSETGRSLRYARWKRVGAASREGHSWAKRRPGAAAGPCEEKVLWHKALRPSRPRPIQQTFRWPRQMRKAGA